MSATIRFVTATALVAALAGCARGGKTVLPDADAGPDAIDAADDTAGDMVPDAEPEAGDVPGEADVVVPLCRPNAAAFPVRPVVQDPPTVPFLRVDGTSIVTAGGTPVALRGVSFGSWLQMETWIPGIGLVHEEELLALLDQRAADLGLADLLIEARAQNLGDFLSETRSHHALVGEWRAWMREHAPAGQEAAVEDLWAWFDGQPWIFEEQGLWSWLAGRFGAAAAEDLRETYAGAFITEKDVAAVADLGLNVIRVPVWYQALETDGPDPVAFRPEGWKHLDDIARWARRHAVWVIIDLHGAPGGQNAADHSGLMDGGHLAAEPRCVERTARLWQALASYFEGDPHVAAFDLLNEPWSLSTEDSYRAVHQAIYEAIRQVDGDHAVMIEDGYLPASVLSSPKEMGWTNALFSIHLYPDASASAEKYAKGIRDGIEALEDTYHWSTRFACPAFLGEFSSAGSGAWAADAMDRAIGELDGRGIHWAAWTWKFGEDSTWGVWHPKAPARIDVKDATEEAIRQAFAGLDSAGFEPNEAYAAALRAHAADPVLPLDP